MAAYSEQEPLHIVHFDAHLDFVDERHGVRHEYGNPTPPVFRKVLGDRNDAARHPQRPLLQPR